MKKAQSPKFKVQSPKGYRTSFEFGIWNLGLGTLIFLLCNSLFIFLSCMLPAQTVYPQKAFISPLDTVIPLVLAGNFAEIRNNHFHGGLDIKTQGVEGKRVYSVADGYITRIKVSSYGYGKSVYINHRNGYTSVYAHLKRFNDEIEKYVRNAQYANETFEIELFPKPSQFPLKQGALIAFSGNTGGSTAPHLHFEIRKSGSENPINPLLFGFDIGDSVRPAIREILITPLDTMSWVNGSYEQLKIPVVKRSDTLRLRTSQEITAYGNIGLAVTTYDQLDASSNKCGVYSISLYSDSQLVFQSVMETFDFTGNRFVNTFVDYYQWKKFGDEFQRSYLEPNNNLNVYKTAVNQGILNFNNDREHPFTYVIKDVYGNSSILRFNIKSVSSPGTSEHKRPPENGVVRFFCDRPNKFKTPEIEIYLPAGILYNDITFQYSVSDTIKNAFAPTFNIHNSYTPLHSSYRITVRGDHVPHAMRKQTALFQILNSGTLSYAGGQWEGNYLICDTRNFGSFTLYPDTVPPEIKPVTIKEGKKMDNNDKIIIKIADGLSGINSFYATIDGKWILMEYDPKLSRIWHEFDEQTGPGNHVFELTAEDNVGNIAVYRAGFIR